MYKFWLLSRVYIVQSRGEILRLCFFEGNVYLRVQEYYQKPKLRVKKLKLSKDISQTLEWICVILWVLMHRLSVGVQWSLSTSSGPYIPSFLLGHIHVQPTFSLLSYIHWASNWYTLQFQIDLIQHVYQGVLSIGLSEGMHEQGYYQEDWLMQVVQCSSTTL